MIAASNVAQPRKLHWAGRLFVWLILTLLLDMALLMVIAQIGTWLLRIWQMALPTWLMFLFPTGGNFALAWLLGLVSRRSPGAIVISLAVLLASLAQVVWALILAFPLDHILNGPH